MITYVMCEGLHVCAYVRVVCTCICVCACVHSIPPSLLYTAVRTIVAIDHMIEIVETAITAHFAAFSCVEDPEREWGIVCETMAAPETIRDTFLTESAVKSSFMCLFGSVLNELSQLKDPREELDMTIKMTNWCGRMKPE